MLTASPLKQGIVTAEGFGGDRTDVMYLLTMGSAGLEKKKSNRGIELGFLLYGSDQLAVVPTSYDFMSSVRVCKVPDMREESGE